MNTHDIIKRAASFAAGTLHTIRMEKNLKTKDGGLLTKITTIQGQVHVPFANTKAVREAVEAGERDAPTMPAWAESVEMAIDGGKAVRLWKHKENGKLYFPLRPTGNQPKSQWLKNGEPVEYSEIESVLYAKDKRKGGDGPEYITVDIQNIKEIR